MGARATDMPPPGEVGEAGTEEPRAKPLRRGEVWGAHGGQRESAAQRRAPPRNQLPGGATAPVLMALCARSGLRRVQIVAASGVSWGTGRHWFDPHHPSCPNLRHISRWPESLRRTLAELLDAPPPPAPCERTGVLNLVAATGDVARAYRDGPAGAATRRRMLEVLGVRVRQLQALEGAHDDDGSDEK